MGIISRWRARREARKKTTTTTTGSYQGPMPSGTTATQEATFRATGTTTSGSGGGSYQGPVQPGVDVETFRKTGVSQPSIQGPTQPGTDVELFRKTGYSQPSTSGGGISPTEMQVLASGGVKVGGVTYIGKSVVPFTGGRSANQLRRDLQVKATEKGYKLGRWSATIPITTGQEETLEQAQGGAMDLLIGGFGGYQPDIKPLDEGGTLYPQPNFGTRTDMGQDFLQDNGSQTGTKGFFSRVGARGQAEYTLLKEGTAGISGTYGGTYIEPPPYGSYVKAFFQEIPSSFPAVQVVAQDVKDFFKPQIDTAKIGLGVIATATKKVTDTPAYQSFKEWNAPRMEAVTSSAEFEVLSKTIVRGLAFTPLAIVGRQAFIETIPLRQRQKPYALENIETYLYKGKPHRVSDYTIYTEKAPPRLQITRKMYQPPKDITYLPSIKTTTRTPYGATSTDAFITMEMKGGKVSSLSGVEGTSQAISRSEILSYQKLTPSKRLLVQRLAESKAGGTPVTGKWIQKMLKIDDQRFFSQIDITKLGKARLTSKGVQLESLPTRRLGSKRWEVQMGALKYKEPWKESYYSYPFGKTKTRWEAITETKLIKETEMYELTKSRVIFKDVTYPFPRATGKTPELKVFTREKKILNIIDDFKDVQVIRTSDINDLKRTSLGKTFQIQTQKQPTLFAPPKVPKAIPRTKIVSSKAESFLTSIPTSAFYGKGMYERTTGGQLPSTQLYATQLPSVVPYSYSPITTRIYTPSAVSISQVNLLKPSYKFDTREISRGMNKEITKEITKEMVKEIQKPMLKETLKVIQKPAQKLILKQYQKTKTPFFYGGFFPRTKITPKEKGWTPIKIKQFKQPKGFPGTYKVYGKRWGKWKVVGGGKSPLEAVGMGESWAKKTLGASFKVPSYKGTKVPGFRTKREKGEIIFIEPKNLRIKKRQTGSKEIPELSWWRNVRSPIKSIIKSPVRLPPLSKKKKKKGIFDFY